MSTIPRNQRLCLSASIIFAALSAAPAFAQNAYSGYPDGVGVGTGGAYGGLPPGVSSGDGAYGGYPPGVYSDEGGYGGYPDGVGVGNGGAYGGLPPGVSSGDGAYGGYPPGVYSDGGGYGGSPGVYSDEGGAYGAVPDNVRVAPSPDVLYEPPYTGHEGCAPNPAGMFTMRGGINPLGVLGMLSEFNERCR